jgi:hypothetical protein
MGPYLSAADAHQVASTLLQSVDAARNSRAQTEELLG